MLCPNCKKQIVDTSTQCPFCSHKIDHAKQLPKEISMRRYQRWFFYALISILISGMVLTIVKIYNVNSEVLTNMAMADQQLKEKEEELKKAKNDLELSKGKLQELQVKLENTENEVALKTEKYKEILFEKGKLEEKYDNERNNNQDLVRAEEECSGKLEQTDAMVYAMIVSLGVGISNDNLSKIPIADANLGGLDQDGDGLSDFAESSLGTDKTKADTDGDGFNDKDELIGGYNPNGEGSMPIDKGFADMQKGKILLQVEGGGEAWYVNPKDSKRYFLGRPRQALELLADL